MTLVIVTSKITNLVVDHYKGGIDGAMMFVRIIQKKYRNINIKITRI